MNGHVSIVTVQRWAPFAHSLFAPSEAQGASKNCSVPLQKRQSLQMAMWKIPWQGGGGSHGRRGTDGSWQVRLMLVGPGDGKHVLTG